MTTPVEKVRIVLSELTNTLYLATKKDKRELNKQELDLIKYKFEKDNECQECNLIGKDNCSTHCFNNLPKSISREAVVKLRNQYKERDKQEVTVEAGEVLKDLDQLLISNPQHDTN